MQDFVFQTRKTGYMGIAGPAFVKTQTGVEISLEELCGIKAHAVKTGQTHLVVEDDRIAWTGPRSFWPFCRRTTRRNRRGFPAADDADRAIPELDTLVPLTASKPFDMRKIITRVVDNGYFFELFKMHATNVIIGFGRFNGRTAGIVASQPMSKAGAIDCDAADKVARFVRFCDLFNIP